MKASLGYKIGIKANIKVLRQRKVVQTLDNQQNLLLDRAMSGFTSNHGYGRMFEIMRNFAIGDDGTANRTDSGAITASQTGTTVTSSAGFFNSGMVGDIIKWDSGEEARINAFTNSTNVEVNESQSVASGEFTSWDVDRTILNNQVQRTNETTQPFTSTSRQAPNKLIFTSETDLGITADTTVREVGFMRNNADQIESRVVLDTPVSVFSGDTLRIQRSLEILASPTDTQSSEDPTIGEGDFAGTGQIEWFTNADQSFIDPATPASGSNVGVDTSGSHQTYPTHTFFISVGNDNKTGGSSTGFVTIEPWFRERTCTFSTDKGNISIKAIIFGLDVSSTSIDPEYKFILTTAQSKSNLQTLTIVLRIELTRTLNNA